jgi:TRAP transporter TAXI family solute receptor
MKRAWNKRWTASAMALIATGFMAAAPADAQNRLAMGGTHSNSGFYPYQVAVVSDWNEVIDGLNITIQELGGADASTDALLRGEVDMGIAVTSTDYAAANEKGADNLRTLFYFAPLPLNWVVAQDAGVDSVDALEQEFSPGGRGTATEKQVEEVNRILGLDLNLHRGGASDALEAYQNRRIAGFVKSGLHPDGYIQQAHASRPVELLSLTDEQVQKIVQEIPYFSAATVDPGDFYGEQPDELKTVQTAIGINTTSELSEEIAYQIAKRIFSPEGLAAAKSGYPPADRVDPAELTLSASVAPLHAGVVRYFKEQGREVPERLIPPESAQ